MSGLKTLSHEFSENQKVELPLFVWEELSAHRNLNTIALRIFNFVHIQSEIDSTHDSISKLF